jgi:hypothetical protein
MLPAEVVGHAVRAHHVPVVLDLRRGPGGEPGQPTAIHPHGEALALDVGRADIFLFIYASERLHSPNELEGDSQAEALGDAATRLYRPARDRRSIA